MITLKDVTIRTRHPILEHVDYAFLNHRIYGVVAENGSGKTTLFRAMANLGKRQGGTILFDGQPVEKRLSHIFYFESIEWLDKNLSGMDYLKFVKKMWKSKLDIAGIVQMWQMEEYIKIPIKKYSLGMKQRLMIGMYQISNADYLIMDEITNGLDEESRKLFFTQIQRLKDEGKTILLSSHYKEEIADSCDIVLQIKDNRLCEVSV